MTWILQWILKCNTETYATQEKAIYYFIYFFLKKQFRSYQNLLLQTAY